MWIRRPSIQGVLLAIGLTSTGSPWCHTAPSPWGFHAHREINRLAVFTLPQEMFGWYKANINYLSEHAVDPDKRRHSVRGEAERHYIDLDHFCDHSDSTCSPFQTIPRSWKAACDSLSEDSLRAYGILPWHVSWHTRNLTDAFRKGDPYQILRLSAELGHYVGDACVPLHTTENYNGQLTGQHGIHAFWETRLPELFSASYDFFTGPAAYISNPLDFIWDRIEESHAAVDSVLSFEQNLAMNWPEDQKYCFEQRGQTISRQYSPAYSQSFHEALDGQVERRMRTAVRTTGSLWYSAWVNAGQPELKLKEGHTLTRPDTLPGEPLPEKLRNSLHQ